MVVHLGTRALKHTRAEGRRAATSRSWGRPRHACAEGLCARGLEPRGIALSALVAGLPGGCRVEVPGCRVGAGWCRVAGCWVAGCCRVAAKPGPRPASVSPMQVRYLNCSHRCNIVVVSTSPGRHGKSKPYLYSPEEDTRWAGNVRAIAHTYVFELWKSFGQFLCRSGRL